jgi:hypothetical protein
VEKLLYNQMKPEMELPDTKLCEFSGPDQPWQIQLAGLKKDIQKR